MGRVQTLLIDTNALYLAGLAAVLRDTRYVIEAQFRDIDEVDWRACDSEPELLIVADVGSDPEKAVARIAKLKAELPSAKLMVLSDQYTLFHMTAVMKAGADGYQLKSISSETLITSLDLLLLGQPILPHRILREVGAIEARIPWPVAGCNGNARPLSEREKEILVCLVGGQANKIIARNLEITEQTVKVHIKAILRKIGVKNRTQAAIWAVDNIPGLEGKTVASTPHPGVDQNHPALALTRPE